MLLDVKGINIRTLAMEVTPKLLGSLKSCFSDSGDNTKFVYDGSIQYERDGIETLQGKVHRCLPMVHFMSILVFEDEHHDPLLVIEINFDGEPGALWPAIDDCLRIPLRKILQCTKRPRSRLGQMYDALLYSDNDLPIAPYLEAIANIPLTPYRGARGMNRQRILNEQKLYEHIQQFLSDGVSFVGKEQSEIFSAVRRSLSKEHFETLAEARHNPTPWSAGKLLDWAFLLLAVFFVLWSVPLLFGLPSFITLLLFEGVAWTPPFFCMLALPLILIFIFRGPVEDLTGFPLSALTQHPLFPMQNKLSHPLINSIVIYLICAVAASIVTIACLLILGLFLFLPSQLIGHFTPELAADSFLYSLFPAHVIDTIFGFWSYVFPSTLLGITVLWIWLRFREVSDSSHDGAVAKSELQKRMEERENYAMHNHMGSLLTVKPGILRYVLNRINHWLLRSLARTVFRNGELGSMRTIHFAHWALIENGNRLLFLSNFDGTWESYLDDFTVKASKGVNLAWSQCIGFPFVRFLIFGGSESGELFKNWARHSMTETLFWYSAYPELTVDMIHRNSRVANGLSMSKLKNRIAYQWWARDL